MQVKRISLSIHREITSMQAMITFKLFFCLSLTNFERQFVCNIYKFKPKSYPTNCVSGGNIKNNCLRIVLSVLQLH